MFELEGKRVAVTDERGRLLRRRATPMGEALVFGLIGSSALVIGGALGAYWQAPNQISGVLLAFASGTLISALAFELFPEAVHLGGLWPAGLGLVSGGLTFVVINTALDSWVAKSAGDPHEVPAPSTEAAEEVSGAEAEQTERVEEAATQGAGAAVGFALLAAVTLDGVPENLALGVSLLSGGGSLALLVAIFCSNFPESLVGAVAMRRGGRSAPFAIGIWALTAALLTAAVVFGRGVFAQFPEESLAFPLAFAGGAVLASLADTLMPEAFEHGRPLNSMATAAGFFVSFVLSG
jgi:ZIP family zinc transporter